MRIRLSRPYAVVLMLAVALGACATQPATEATPRVVVSVTPAPTSTPPPTPEATADPRQAWFAAACQAAERLARATDGWIQDTRRTP